MKIVYSGRMTKKSMLAKIALVFAMLSLPAAIANASTTYYYGPNDPARMSAYGCYDYAYDYNHGVSYCAQSGSHPYYVYHQVRLICGVYAWSNSNTRYYYGPWDYGAGSSHAWCPSDHPFLKQTDTFHKVVVY